MREVVRREGTYCSGTFWEDTEILQTPFVVSFGREPAETVVQVQQNNTRGIRGRHFHGTKLLPQ